MTTSDAISDVKPVQPAESVEAPKPVEPADPAEPGKAVAPVDEVSPAAQAEGLGPVSAPPPDTWFHRVFSNDFSVEDLILYTIALLLITFFWITFGRMHAAEKELITSISDPIIKAWEPRPWRDYLSWEDGSLNDNYLRAQMGMTAMRYQQASISTAALSTRKNLGFVVGTIVLIFGCIIIIRGVRDDIGFTGNLSQVAKAKLTSSSPGVFVVLIGGAIVLSSILTSGDRPFVEDEGIHCPLCRAVVYQGRLEIIPDSVNVIRSQEQSAATPSPTPRPTMAVD